MMSRRKYVNKWMIVIKAMAVALVVAGVKFVLHTLNLEFIRIPWFSADQRYG